MIAVQGPKARETGGPCIDASIASGAGAEAILWHGGGRLFIARTGYTGEDGWEIAMPAEQAHGSGISCLQRASSPAGLARATHCASKRQ